MALSKYKNAAQMEANIDNAAPRILPNGNWERWDSSLNTWADTGKKAQGERGLQGVQGKQGVQGEKGDKGDKGDGLNLAGTYPTLDELQAAYPSGDGTNSYLVNGDIYVWNSTAWINGGRIQGVQGEKGETGAVGEKGETGLQGIQGDKGDKGEVGIQGVPGETYNDTAIRADIAAAQSSITALSAKTVVTLTHTTTAATHALVGTLPTADIITANFKATADYAEGDGFTLNGTAYTAIDSLGEPIAGFKTGAVIGIEVDTVGKKLNFKSGGKGGGATEQLPSPLTSFTAQAADTQAAYTFEFDESDSALSGIYLVRKVGSMPMILTDGVKLDVGKVTSYIDTGLENNTTYYVRAFPYNSKKQVQNALNNAVVSFEPSADILISTLPVGSLVVDKNSTYSEIPIVWVIAGQNHQGYPSNSTTLITKFLPMNECFDAKEPASSVHRLRGNHIYRVSNIDQFINSDAVAGAWWSARWASDAPPSLPNTNASPYTDKAGFLNGFSQKFKQSILDTNIIVAKSKVSEGGGQETLTRKVFLLSLTELGLPNETSIAEGSKLAIFTNDASRIFAMAKTPTVATAYRVRTPSTLDATDLITVSTAGTIFSRVAAFSGGSHGNPFALNIDNVTKVSPFPNAQGQYEILF